MKVVVQILMDIIIALLIAMAVLFFFQPTIVQQTSMTNTFQENDYIIVYRQAYRKAQPQRKDIIVFDSGMPEQETNSKLMQIKSKFFSGALYIKRVIAVPGDELMISEGNVYVNGELQSEPYIKEPYTPAPEEPYIVDIPEGKYFVMGDNRSGSLDSRSESVGLVSEDKIIGRVVYRVSPNHRAF